MAEHGTLNQQDTQVPKFNSFQIFRGSISIENNGSVARDHMANERTFLAWLRTSLSFITVGVAITQLFKLKVNSKINLNDKLITLSSNERLIEYHTFGKCLGSLFIILGITTLVLGLLRFFQVQHALIYGHYPVAKVSLTLIILLTLSIIVVTLAMILKTY